MTDGMDTSVSSSPIRTYMDNSHKMRVSNDEDRSDPKDLCYLGVVDLDLSLSPDEFGLRAFDSTKPLTRMLPGSFPCELRLMLPDSKIATDGFHDVIIKNLATSPTWRSRHISHCSPPTMAEGRLQDYAEAIKGGGAIPSFCSSSTIVGVSADWTGILLHLSGGDRIGPERPHD